MQVKLERISLRETLHFLGWRGAPLDEALLHQIRSVMDEAISACEPRVVMRRFALESGGMLRGTTFQPTGDAVGAMLAPCCEAVLIAGTLGAACERLLLRTQARDPARAVLLDAALSAGIEAVMDAQENALRASLMQEGLYLTDRFSPGYGDMPMEQTRSICEVLSASRAIGLTVSQSGIMIPRKSVTAIMGVSREPVNRRPSGCEGCDAKETCALRRGSYGKAENTDE